MNAEKGRVWVNAYYGLWVRSRDTHCEVRHEDEGDDGVIGYTRSGRETSE